MGHLRWLAVTICLLSDCRQRPDPLPGFPRLVLWAWERPERLDFVNPRSAGVAFLARTVSWRAGEISSRPRLQPLRVPPGTPLMAVVRLESHGAPFPDVATVRGEILKVPNMTSRTGNNAGSATRGSRADEGVRPTSEVRALQVDFDARLSERAWYTQLLRELRRELDPSIPLSITALASWCDKDTWIEGLPVSEAVPMLFRMGAGEPRDTRDFRVGACRASFGISTDELPADLPHGRRLFVFLPRAWDEDAYRAAVRLAVKWR